MPESIMGPAVPEVITPLTAQQQSTMSHIMYAMKLEFYSDQFMEGAFPGTDFQLSNGRDSYIEQTVWFIPDPETLSRYASIIEEGLNKSFEPAHIKFRNTRFTGYKYLYAIEPSQKDAEEESK